jgi:DNA-binding NarL/FixJ family response regulator
MGTSFGFPTHAKDGRNVWLEVMAFTTNGNVSPPFVIHVFHDATRTKQLLRDLRTHIGDSQDGEERLTRRELQVLRLMGEGLGTAAAAARLRVSRATIRNHVQNIFGKLGRHSGSRPSRTGRVIACSKRSQHRAIRHRGSLSHHAALARADDSIVVHLGGSARW